MKENVKDCTLISHFSAFEGLCPPDLLARRPSIVKFWVRLYLYRPQLITSPKNAPTVAWAECFWAQSAFQKRIAQLAIFSRKLATLCPSCWHGSNFSQRVPHEQLPALVCLRVSDAPLRDFMPINIFEVHNSSTVSSSNNNVFVAGTVHWLNHTSLGPPARHVLQRSLPLLSKKKIMPAFVVSNSLRPSRSKPRAQWTHQHANCLPICEERSARRQAMTGKELFCSADSFGAGATLQRCLVAWHLARPWLHGLMICIFV